MDFCNWNYWIWVTTSFRTGVLYVKLQDNCHSSNNSCWTQTNCQTFAYKRQYKIQAAEIINISQILSHCRYPITCKIFLVLTNLFEFNMRYFNRIQTWSSIDALNSYTNLSTLRFTKNPLSSDMGAGEFRMVLFIFVILMWKYQRLKRLNISKIYASRLLLLKQDIWLILMEAKFAQKCVHR